MMMPREGDTTKSASVERGETIGDRLTDPGSQLVVFWAVKSRSMRVIVGSVRSIVLTSSFFLYIAVDMMMWKGVDGISNFGTGTVTGFGKGDFRIGNVEWSC